MLNVYVNVSVYKTAYMFQQCVVVTITLGGFVTDQMLYVLESAQYLLYHMIIDKYILDLICKK